MENKTESNKWTNKTNKDTQIVSKNSPGTLTGSRSTGPHRGVKDQPSQWFPNFVFYSKTILQPQQDLRSKPTAWTKEERKKQSPWWRWGRQAAGPRSSCLAPRWCTHQPIRTQLAGIMSTPSWIQKGSSHRTALPASAPHGTQCNPHPETWPKTNRTAFPLQPVSGTLHSQWKSVTGHAEYRK